MLSAVIAVLALVAPPVDVSARDDAAAPTDLGPQVSAIVRTSDALFYLDRSRGAAAARLMVLRPATVPRLLLDPVELAKRLGAASRLSIAHLLPSPDGAHIALSLVPAGVDSPPHTRIIDAHTGALLADDLPGSPGGPTAWSLDGTTLFYQRSAELAPGGVSAGERGLVVASHRLGMSGADAPVFGCGVDPNVPLAPGDDPALVIPPGSSYAIGVVRHAARGALTLYVGPVAAVLSGGQIPWRRIVDVADGVSAFDVSGDEVYLLVNRSAVTALDVADPDSAQTPVVAADANSTVDQIAVAGDALYLRGTRSGAAELRKLPWDADGKPGASGEVALPLGAALPEFATGGGIDGAVAVLVAPAQPARVAVLDARGTFVDTGIGEAGAHR